MTSTTSSCPTPRWGRSSASLRASSWSGRGWLIFWSLFVEEAEVERVMAQHDLKRDAVYAWRSRLQKAISQIRRDLESDLGPPPGSKGSEVA